LEKIRAKAEGMESFSQQAELMDVSRVLEPITRSVLDEIAVS
jgi:hypothetical protein